MAVIVKSRSVLLCLDLICYLTKTTFCVVQSELFLLVTDQGFLTESNVVWETLSNVDGDCHFVDANFCTYTKPPPSNEPIPTSPYSSGDEQINSE